VNETPRVRLDRWLWAARFFKTRAAAKKALESGKVNWAGQRPKPSREVVLGAVLTITRGAVEQTVRVTALDERRGSASDAARLYSETPDSIARREATATQRRLQRNGLQAPSGRPDRRQRRALQALKHTATEEPPR
jgi:ribosome-associated heat shock protein Hsp15